MTIATDAEAAAVSFAHLSGIVAPFAAKAEDKDEDREEENPEEDADKDEDGKEKSKKAKAKSKAKADDEDDGSDADMSEEDGDDKDKKDAKSAKSAERARWAAVLGHKSFVRAPAMGARLLATTNLSSKTIVGLLGEAPAAAASAPASGSRADRNPQLGTGSPARSAASDNHMVTAMQKAREAAARTGSRR